MRNRNVENPASHVLVICDDDLLLGRLESVVRHCGLIPEKVSTREEVRQTLGAADIDRLACILVADGTDGKPAIEYAALISQRDPHLCCILILYETDKHTLLRALRLRVRDVITQPVDETELQSSLEKAVAMNLHRRMAMVSKVQAREVTKIHRRLMTGHQFSLKNFRPDYRKKVESAFFPACEAGGDFGVCARLDDDRILLVFGDISGHDYKSSFISAYFFGVNRGMLLLGAKPREVFERFNKFLVENWNAACPADDIPTSIAVGYAILDFSRKEISYCCNALPPFILCDDMLNVSFLGRSNPPLGWFAGSVAPVETVPMPECGCIVMATDGLDSLSDGSLCTLGVADAILSLPPDSSAKNAIFERQSDDIFIQRFAWEKAGEGHGLLRPIYHQQVASTDTACIDVLQNVWDKTLRAIIPGLSGKRRREILLSCREALVNAMEHGCACEGSRCSLTMARLGRDTLRIRIRGDAVGAACDCEPYRKPDAHIPFGLKIIHGYADSFVYDEKNNSIILDFRVTAADAAGNDTDEFSNETIMLLP
jgi:DNA-binding NarL/FixJ family response regulator